MIECISFYFILLNQIILNYLIDFEQKVCKLLTVFASIYILLYVQNRTINFQWKNKTIFLLQIILYHIIIENLKIFDFFHYLEIILFSNYINLIDILNKIELILKMIYKKCQK